MDFEASLHWSYRRGLLNVRPDEARTIIFFYPAHCTSALQWAG